MSSGVRILIVDDDVPTRIGLRAILAPEPGFAIVGEAETGTEALAQIGSLNPDVVLMDVRLPDGDGIELTAAILAKSDPAPRVVVLTTFDFDEYAYRALQAGASAFLLKRTPAEEIVTAVSSVAAGDVLAAPARMTALVDQFARPGSARQSDRFLPLTPREYTVLRLIARGLSNAEIADELMLSLDTVKTHVKHVYMKCGARDRAQAVIAAYERGLVHQSGSSGGVDPPYGPGG